MYRTISDNIEELTLSNTNFRQVISTSKEMQVVLMRLLPMEDIGMETHDSVSQFIRVEKGEGIVHIDYGEGLNARAVRDGDFLFVPSGSSHNVTNTSRVHPLMLYTIYSPPEHAYNRVDTHKPVQ